MAPEHLARQCFRQAGVGRRGQGFAVSTGESGRLRSSGSGHANPRVSGSHQSAQRLDVWCGQCGRSPAGPAQAGSSASHRPLRDDGKQGGEHVADVAAGKDGVPAAERSCRWWRYLGSRRGLCTATSSPTPDGVDLRPATSLSGSAARPGPADVERYRRRACSRVR